MNSITISGTGRINDELSKLKVSFWEVCHWARRGNQEMRDG